MWTKAAVNSFSVSTFQRVAELAMQWMQFFYKFWGEKAGTLHLLWSDLNYANQWCVQGIERKALAKSVMDITLSKIPPSWDGLRKSGCRKTRYFQIWSHRGWFTNFRNAMFCCLLIKQHKTQQNEQMEIWIVSFFLSLTKLWLGRVHDKSAIFKDNTFSPEKPKTELLLKKSFRYCLQSIPKLSKTLWKPSK